MSVACRALAAALLIFTGAPSRAADAIELRVMSFNIWYGGEQVSLGQVVSAISAAHADIVGLQEPDGNTLRIAQGAGYPYVDLRRHLISRFPLFDSGTGEFTGKGRQPYSVTALDRDALHAWALVAPGRVVAVGNTHLTSDPYGPELLRDGRTLAAMLANETATRVAEARPLAEGFGKLAAGGVPLFLTGDFNSPSHLDWTARVQAARRAVLRPVAWPVTTLLTEAGLSDSYRSVHPDPIGNPGLTFTPGYPHPFVRPTETHDRIDYVWSANATILNSEIVGEAGNPQVDIAVMPWPSDHRAVVSTFRVAPIEAPPLIGVEPRAVVAGDTFLLRASMPGQADWTGVITRRGGDARKDALTGIEAVGSWERPSIKLATAGLEPGRYDAVLLEREGKELARTRFSVMAPDQRAAVAVARPRYAPGEPIEVSWSGAPGFRFDWVAIYARHGANVYGYLGFAPTNALHEGMVLLDAAAVPRPLPPGDYEVRLMHDDHYAVLASAAFSVVAPGD